MPQLWRPRPSPPPEPAPTRSQASSFLQYDSVTPQPPASSLLTADCSPPQHVPVLGRHAPDHHVAAPPAEHRLELARSLAQRARRLRPGQASAVVFHRLAVPGMETSLYWHCNAHEYYRKHMGIVDNYNLGLIKNDMKIASIESLMQCLHKCTMPMQW